MPRKKSRRLARRNVHTADAFVEPSLSEDEAMERIDNLEVPFLLLLDGVQDPHNLGACLRSADAAGVHLVLAPKDHTVGLTETARRVSCGGADNVPYVRVANLGRTMDRLREMGVRLVGTGDRQSRLLYEETYGGPLSLVMGGEAEGIRRKTANKCDALVRIPMAGTVDCLNLSVATGVCLFEALRQRLSGIH